VFCSVKLVFGVKNKGILYIFFNFLFKRKHILCKKKKIDWDSYGTETERGKQADEYMEKIRGNDRV